jgi:PAS domain S-box-containing protein
VRQKDFHSGHDRLQGDSQIEGGLQSEMRSGGLEGRDEALREKQAEVEKVQSWYANFYDFAPVGYFTLDDSGIIQDLNPVGSELLGVERSFPLGVPFRYFVAPKSRKSFRSHFQKLLKGPGTLTFSLKLLQKNGTVLEVLLKGQGGSVQGQEKRKLCCLAATDITDRMHTEEALRRSEEKYRSIFENAVMGVFQTTPDGRYIDVNPALARMFGYGSPQEMMTSISDIEKQQYVNPADRARLKKLYEELDAVRGFETEVFRQDGGKVWIAMNARAVRDRDGGILYYEGTTENISERKQAEEELKHSKLYVERIANASPNTLHVYDVDDGKYLYISAQVSSMLGYAPEEMYGMSSDGRLAMIHPDHRSAAVEYVRRLVASRDDGVAEIELPLRHKNGDWRWIRTRSLTFVRKEDGLAKSFVGTSEDVTDRIREEKERARLAAAVEQASEGVVITDGVFVIEYANPSFLRLTGYALEEIISRDVKFLRSDRRPAAFYESIRDTARTESAWTGIYPWKRKDGGAVVTRAIVSAMRDESGAVLAYVVHCQDITDQLRLEDQLRQRQKMEAIGTLAGGIAHDFNNILAGVIGFVEMILEDTPLESRMGRRLDLALKGAYRGRDLVRQILAFSHQSEQERKPVALSEVVEEGMKLLRPALPATIAIKTEIAASDDVILADSVQMHQILMNLCTNAAFAMRDKGGELGITLTDATLSDVDSMPCSGMKQGKYVVLTVSDTGCGMGPEILERIFDPFFTTKARGEGTGMGLSVVHGIVKSHAGYITVSSKQKKGSSFQIYLPRAKRHIGAEVETLQAARGGTEHVLFVDDEDILAELNRERLVSLGYKAVISTSSIETLEIFKAKPEAFDLVITDYTMPRLTGIDLAGEVRKIRGDIPIILCTGYGDFVSQEKAAVHGIRKILMKPFTKVELAEAIRYALGVRIDR